MNQTPCLHIVGETLDDLLFDSFSLLLKQPFSNSATRSLGDGSFSELIGVTLELKNPQARLSKSDAKGKPFSPLGELLWYLSGSDELDFIYHYIPKYKDESYDGKHVYGAYGPRLFHSAGLHNQIENVLALLQDKPSSRRAVIQLFESRDIAPNSLETVPSIPCTCHLQLLCRNNALHMIANMRSNDVFKGLPHDIYAFTMLQEYFASALNLNLGTYKHFAGSLHMYEKSKAEAEAYIKEGVHQTTPNMTAMPKGNQKAAIEELICLENKIRKNEEYDIEKSSLDPYWKELGYLLAFFKAWKDKNNDLMKEIRLKITNPIYGPFLDKKILS